MLKPADLCGCVLGVDPGVEARQAERAADRQRQRGDPAEPRRRCSDHRNRISAGAVPNAILSARLSSSAPNLLLAREQPRDAAVEPVEHAGDDDRSQQRLVSHSLADREAHAGQAEAQRQRGDRVGRERAERNAAAGARRGSLTG